MVSPVDLVSSPSSTNPYIHALTGTYVYRPGYAITYVLQGNPGDTGVFGGALWAEKNAAQAFSLAAQAWAAVANISITGVQVAYDGSTSQGDYTWVEQLMTLEDNILGQHSLPGPGNLGGEFNNTHPYFTTANNAVGGYSFLTFLHEIGHGLGLMHPHEEGNSFPGVDGDDDAGDNQLNQSIYTVMSYNDNFADAHTSTNAYGWSATPMAFDIAAIQHFYGANMSAATGNNMYMLPSVNAAGTYWSCIWDAAGTDTISGANTSGCVIDLRAATLLDEQGGGGWISSGNGIAGGFTIANGVTIENATGSAMDDTIRGNDAANTLIGNGGQDTLYGNGGDDRLEGSGTLEGGAGNDRLEGSGSLQGDDGNDVLIAGNEISSLDGGAGNDQLTGGNLTPTLHGGSGDDTVTAGSGDGQLYGDEGADHLTGKAGNDEMHGGAGDDYLVGGAGNNIFDGGDGFDTYVAGAGNDTYYIDSLSELISEGANQGNDTLVVGFDFYLPENFENIGLRDGSAAYYAVGNSADNSIGGSTGDNLLIGGLGNDQIGGGLGNDALFGETGNDTLDGGSGVDYEVGGVGNDTVLGGSGADALYGEDGNDVLWADFIPSDDPYAGSSIQTPDFVTDILVGGAGADVLHGDSGLADYDLMDGGAGNDAYYVDTGDDLTFEAAGGGTDTVYANVKGENNGVYLYANVENLVLLKVTKFGVGNELANTMTGSASGNWLLGGAGNDTLNGKGGGDVLFGEAGADTFVFEHGTGGDVLGDFAAGTDKIDLSAFGLTWQAVQNSMHEVSGTTAIDLGGGDFIVLNGVASAALHAGDFILSGSQSAQLEAQVADEQPGGVHGRHAGLIHEFGDPDLVHRLDGDALFLL